MGVTPPLPVTVRRVTDQAALDERRRQSIRKMEAMSNTRSVREAIQGAFASFTSGISPDGTHAGLAETYLTLRTTWQAGMELRGVQRGSRVHLARPLPLCCFHHHSRRGDEAAAGASQGHVDQPHSLTARSRAHATSRPSQRQLTPFRWRPVWP